MAGVIAGLCPGPGTAQSLDDTLKLRVVEVIAPRSQAFDAGAKVHRIDSAALARHATADLGDLLARESTVFIKGYGTGGLATTAFRGGSAQHTAVLWNGLPITSPLNGQVDLSLVPLGVANAVTVQYGGGTALWGSGAVGGAIQLDNVPHFGRGVQVDGTVALGSFNDRRQQLRAEIARDRWITRVALDRVEALNDFPYRSGPAHRSMHRRLTNAALSRDALVVEQHARLGDRDRIGVRYWYQQATRGIPPTRLQSTSSARQEDHSHRLMADWQRGGQRWSSIVRGGWFDEDLAWFEASDVDAVWSRWQQLVAEGEVRYRPAGAHLIHVGVNYNHSRAWTQGYAHGPQQDRQAIFALYRHQPGTRATLTASARQEWVDGQWMPFTGSVGAEYRLVHWAAMKAQVARLHRIPTLNDRFWEPGGVPDLRAEQGHSADLGVRAERRFGAVDVRSEVTVFHRLMDDWIIWLPGAAYWTPRNIMQVWSRGVETDSELRWRRERTTWRIGVMTAHVVSTNQVAKDQYDDSVDRQLIMVPMYSGHARAGVARGHHSLDIVASYTGYRYTSTDNRSYLEPYWLMHATASVRLWQRPRWQVDLFLQVHNLLDTDYEVMPSRPMPPRSHRIGIKVHFDRPPRPTSEP